MWWKYIVKLVLEDVCERKRRSTWGYLAGTQLTRFTGTQVQILTQHLAERRKQRLRYTELYVRQRADPAHLSKRELAELVKQTNI